VRWGLPECQEYGLEDPVEIVDDLIVPEPDDPIEVTGELGRTLGVGVLLRGMLAAVQFDRQFPRWTGEVNNAASDRMLATELPRQARGSQNPPQSLLDIGGIAPKPARHQGPLLQCHRRHPPPHPDPLRPRGRRGSLGRRQRKCVNGVAGYEGKGGRAASSMSRTSFSNAVRENGFIKTGSRGCNSPGASVSDAPVTYNTGRSG